LGAELRRCRKKRGLSQAQLSLQIAKRQATISNIESEGAGTLETLFAILAALNLEIALRPRSKGARVNLGDVF
jgi:HTH-type transcriptional regulator/antitoxin HipB